MSSPLKNEISFEKAMDRLDEIVTQMEGDRMPLDEMVASYEEGMGLLKVCRQRIDAARRRVEIITADAEGKATLATFDPASAAATEISEEKAKPTAPARRKKAVEVEDDTDDIRLF